jgi:hypothetical protein
MYIYLYMCIYYIYINEDANDTNEDIGGDIEGVYVCIYIHLYMCIYYIYN